MVKLYKDLSVEQYTNELSSRKIVPGGGSVSALVASLAAGLNLMVINFSYKADTTDAIVFELNELKESQIKIKEQLIHIVDEDAIVFTDLMKILSLKGDAQFHFKRAAIVPMDVCRLCEKIINVTERILEIGNKNLICDTGCASNFVSSALDSSSLNVLINLKYIEDKVFVEELQQEIQDILGKVRKKSENISAQVNGFVRS